MHNPSPLRIQPELLSCANPSHSDKGLNQPPAPVLAVASLEKGSWFFDPVIIPEPVTATFPTNIVLVEHQRGCGDALGCLLRFILLPQIGFGI